MGVSRGQQWHWAAACLVAFAACRAGHVDPAARLQAQVRSFSDQPAAQHFTRDGEVLHPVFGEAPRGTARAAELALPVRADGSFHVADPASGLAVDAQLVGASRVDAEPADAFVTYRAAYHGGDVLHRATVEGTEDYVWFEQRPAAPEAAYAVTLGSSIAGLRLAGGVLEFLDAGGVPRLRVGPASVVGADGTHVDATISVEGCAVDTNLAGPWGRAVTPPGARDCTLRVTWPEVSYPAVLDPQWVTTGSMSYPRYWHTSAVLSSGTVLVAGGQSGTSCNIAVSELFDPTTLTWSTTGSLVQPRSLQVMGVVGGHALIAGGRKNCSASQVLATGETYNATLGTWVLTPNSMSVARQSSAAAVTPSGLLVAGGATAGANGLTYLKAVDLYNASTGRWATEASLSTARASAAAIAVGSQVLVAGGYGKNGMLANAELSNAAYSNWSSSKMNVAHAETTAVLMSGSVLIAGGGTTSAELFDVASGKWSLAGTLSDARQSLVVFPFGTQALAPGGQATGTGALSSSDVYNSWSSTWSAGSPLNTPRYYYSGAMIADGILLVSGGENSNGVLGSSEMISQPVACVSAAGCLSGNCVDGYCCNTSCNAGQCQRCDLPQNPGICLMQSAGGDGNPTCAPYVCSGGASCTTSCTLSSQCASTAYCSGGKCVPLEQNGTSCSTGSVCLSGVCASGVCCNVACNGCGVCSAAQGATTDGTCSVFPQGTSGTCGQYTCDGSSGVCPTACTTGAQCVSGDYCTTATGSAVGQCQPQFPQGSSCKVDAQCESGFCTDGVCCSARCSGTCQTCVASPGGTCTALPKGSSGNGGQCTPYACDGVVSSCTTSCGSDADCASTGYCSQGACVARQAAGLTCSQSDQCLSGSCAGGTCCATACSGQCQTCANAAGTCQTLPSGSAGSPSCAPYVCTGGTTCPTSCTSDAQCAGTDYCNLSTSQCTPKLGPGSMCSTADQCLGGFCADGVCCNSSCTGSCASCALPGSLGTCTPEPQGTASTCAPYVCDGVSTTCPFTCTTNAQCPSTTFCNGGQCAPLFAQGAACSSGTQCQSSFCSDGVCCDAACSGQCDVCSRQRGSPVSGHCVPLGGYGGSPACQPYVCDGTSASCPASCTSDAQCVGTDYCNAAGQCVPAQGVGAACTEARQCSSGSCVSGVCCGTSCTGPCQACSVAQGSTADGICSIVPGQQSPVCGPYLCQAGSPNCSTACASDKDCAQGTYCSNGACLTAQPSGAGCGTDPRQCQSGNCVDGVCCDQSCSGACQVCLASMGAPQDGTCATAPAGFKGSPSCSPASCDGTQTVCATACMTDADCASGAYCNNGTCALRGALGAPCDSAGGCTSGFCVDGVCCNDACSGTCVSCNLPGEAGTCHATPLGGTPRTSCGAYECAGSGPQCPTSCSSDASCIPGDACIQHTCQPKEPVGQTCSSANLCASGFCTQGVCCNAACTGGCSACASTNGASSNGMCTVLPQGSPGMCGAYLCDGQNAQCPTACTSDASCSSGNYCNGTGQCVPRQANGATCGGAGECQSGFCVDGVCCNSACDGTCAACNLAPNVGTCSTAPAGMPVGNRTCPGEGTTCGGACDGTHSATCAFPTASTLCGAASCADSGKIAPPPRCDGEGQCAAGTPVSCAPYSCQNGACLNQCAQASDCAPGSACQSGKCIGLQPAGSPCGDASVCESGACVDGVCCSTACDGACGRCDMTGNMGTCVAAPAGSQPRDGNCAPLLCDGTSTSCPVSCSGSMDCATGFACIAGECVPQQPIGATCNSAAQCETGFCVDGVCCDQACDGSCEACALPGQEGTCAFVKGAPAAGRTACNGTGACGGTCDGTQADCTYPGSSETCAPAFCSDGVAVSASTCDGAGTCAVGTTTTCVAGCAGDHCANPSSVARQGGCASTEGMGWLALIGLVLVRSRRRLVRG